MSYDIVIDLGHGGTDPGACGNNFKEKTLVLSIGKELNIILKRCKVDAKFTRLSDTTLSLSKRVQIANATSAKLFLSIHINSATNKTAQGLEVFSHLPSTENFATTIYKQLVADKLYTEKRGVKNGNYYVLRETNARAALAELGFISNYEDAKYIANNIKKYAESLAKGICKQLGKKYIKPSSNSNKPNPTSKKFENGSYSGKKAKVTASVLNVRWDKGTKYKIIAKEKKGHIFKLGYCTNSWIGVYGYKGNKGLGYVHTDYLELI